MLRILFCLILLSTAASAEPEIGMAFPPVSRPQDRAFTQDTLGQLGIQHIRIAENWRRRGITPTAEDFAPLQRRIGDLRAGGLRVMLTVQSDAPDAACRHRNDHGCLIAEDAPFEQYIATLLSVVGPQLDAIQFGNEWDNQFTGTPEQYVTLHNRFSEVVRQHQPHLPLVLGGITGGTPYSDAVCTQGFSQPIANLPQEDIIELLCSRTQLRTRTPAITMVLAMADYDVADIHLYDAPMLWPAAVRWISSRSHAPIWVSEFGGPHPTLEPNDRAYQARRLQEYLNTIQTLPIERAYYFKLLDDPNSYHRTSGLFDWSGHAKPALAVFADAVQQRN